MDAGPGCGAAEEHYEAKGSYRDRSGALRDESESGAKHQGGGESCGRRQRCAHDGGAYGTQSVRRGAVSGPVCSNGKRCEHTAELGSGSVRPQHGERRLVICKICVGLAAANKALP